MKNVRVGNGSVQYDCDGEGCSTPGIPHKIPLEDLFATLETIFREFYVNGDPRLEAVDVAIQMVYEKVYGTRDRPYPLGADAPWHDQFNTLMKVIDAHYAAVVDDEGVARKELLN